MRISHGTRKVDGHSVRPEIQALRALAVVLVVIYHVNPYGLLPGGYIGVDVFFVISGFLITAHIAKGLERDGGFKLPASTCAGFDVCCQRRSPCWPWSV